MVRVAPNELSFATERALKDIHNPGPKGENFTKKGTSEDLILRLVFSATNLLTVDENDAHKSLRAVLQPAFTAKAMREQEEITQHHVQKTLNSILSAAHSMSGNVNLTQELNKLVWGNVGNLCFGEPVSQEQLGMMDPSLPHTRDRNSKTWSGVDHHEVSKHIHAKLAPILEFLQYLTSMPILGTAARVSVAICRHFLGFAGNIMGKNELERWAITFPRLEFTNSALHELD